MKSLSLVTRAGGLALAVILLALASGRGPVDVAAQTGPWVAPESEKAKKNPQPADKNRHLRRRQREPLCPIHQQLFSG